MPAPRSAAALAAVVALLAAPAGAAADDDAERLLVRDGTDRRAQVDVRELRLTVPKRRLARTLAVRVGAPLRASGPLLEIVFGSRPDAYGANCLPMPGGAVTLALRLASGPQRAIVGTATARIRTIVWPGVDARELVVHIPPHALPAAPRCVAALASGQPPDPIGPAVPRPGAWPLLVGGREDLRTGGVSTGVRTIGSAARIRFEAARFTGPDTVLRASGPWRALPQGFGGRIADRRARPPLVPFAWRAVAVNAAGAAYAPPRIVRFADVAPPRVRLLPASGMVGSPLALRGAVADDSRRARVTVELRDGSRVVARASSGLRRTGVGLHVLGRLPTTGARAGTLTACAVATDASGNRSRPACAAVVLVASDVPAG